MDSRRLNFTRLYDSTLWLGFLLIVIALSFLTQRFDSTAWQWFATWVFGYCAVVLFSAAAGLVRLNYIALRAGVAILLLQIMICAWLYLQMTMPFSLHRLLPWYQELEAPKWYQPAAANGLTPDKARWLFLSSLFTVFWFVISLGMIRNRSRLKQLLWVLAILSVFHAVVGIVALEKSVFLVDRSQLDGHFSVARAWFVNRNHFAAFLVLSGTGLVAIFLHGLLQKQATDMTRKVSMAMFTLGFVGIALALILSQSRAGLLSPLVAFAVILPWLRPAARDISRRTKFYAVLLLLALPVVVLFWFGEPLLQRLMNLGLGERIIQWEITLKAISMSPWFGFGGGSYATVFQIVRDHEDLRRVIYNQSHSEYLHVWLEQGLVGLVLWLSLIVYTLYQAWKGIRNNRSGLERATILVAVLGIIAASVQAMVDFNLQVMVLRSYFFLLVALIIVAPTIHKQDRSMANRRRRFDSVLIPD